ncbi:MAG: hypothetical protein ACFB15_32165 [Cyclobacteriaceae bacterium]
MDYSIILAVLSSSLLAAGLTGFINWRLQKQNYKREYYKKLLDKRIKAYEAVEGIVEQLYGQVQIEDGRLCPKICASGQEYFWRFVFDLYSSINNSTWLSSGTGRLLTEFNAFLLQSIDHRIDENADYDSQLLRIGAEQLEQVRDFREKLKLLLYQDFRTLHRIDSFVKNKEPSHPGIPLPPKPIHMKKKPSN